MTFALAAAGTGGHVFPALAVADSLVAAGVSKSDIVFFGGDRMESVAVPEAGYEFVSFDIKGLQRSLSKQNLRLPAMVRAARKGMEREMTERKVRAVCVFGGYVSVPAAFAARRVGATVFLHEQNAVPGLANRIVASRATRSYVAFPAATARLKGASVIGNPLRSSIADFDQATLRPKAMDRYNVPDVIPVLGVIGGSLGAKVLNEVTLRIAADADPGSFSIVHLTGRSHFDAIAPIADKSPLVWRAVAFEADMEFFYAASDVVLSRAGALTMSELAATGTPAVTVPYAATGNHQAENARLLESAGGILKIDESDIDRVPVELQQLLMDDGRREAMARAARGIGRSDAADVLAHDLIEAVDG